MDRSGSVLSLAAQLGSWADWSGSLGTLAARLSRGTDSAEMIAAWNHCINLSAAGLTVLLLGPESKLRPESELCWDMQCVPFTPLWEFISHAVPLMSGAPHSVRFWKWNSLQGNQGNHCGVNWILLISHPLSYTGPNTREYYGTLWLFAGLRRAVSPHLFLAALSTAAL